MSTAADVIAEQRVLWSAAPEDWANLAERENESLYATILDATAVAPGTRLLDVGCGSGLLCQLAAERGASLTGVDVTPALLAIARERVPDGEFRECDMSSLPFPSAGFDVVTSVNAFQFALDPAEAFAQAARVLAPGGLLATAVFAEPERNEGTALHLAMKSLVTDSEADGYAPYALSEAQGLLSAVRDAGLEVRDTVEVPVTWRYDDRDSTLRALLASAGGARSVRAAGHERVVEVLTAALEPFTGVDGVVSLRNLFRYVIGEKSA